MCYKIQAFFIFLLVSSQSLLAQSTGNSPYSSYGLGDFEPGGYIRNIGMGNVGISLANPEYINPLNPALVTNKRMGSLDSTIKYMIFEAGVTAQFRGLLKNELSQRTGGGNFSYFAFLFPVSKRWSSSVGLRPYSVVNNTYKTQSSVGSALFNNYEDNNGGISQFYLSNGLDISRSFSVGVQVGYLFGKINREFLTQPFVPAAPGLMNQTGQNLNTSYSGFEIRPGFQFRKAIMKDTSESGQSLYLSVGGTANFTSLRAKEQLKYVTKRVYDEEYIDTLLPAIYWKPELWPTTSSNLKLPNSYSFGISLDDPSKWGAEIDFTYAPWSGFRGEGNVTYQNSYTVNIGGEYKLGRDENIKRKELRAGFSYSKTPYSINGTQINDVNFTLGSTLPFGRKDARFKSKPLTKINLALVAGQRGTTDNNLVRENYIRFYAGILINDRWFQKRKID